MDGRKQMSYTLRPRLGSALTLETQVHEFGEGLTEVCHEFSLILVVHFSVLLEPCIRGKDKVARKHHQITRRILILEWSCPWLSIVGFLHRPLFLEEQTKIFIRNRSRRPRPWSPKARRSFVAAPKSVRSAESPM